MTSEPPPYEPAPDAPLPPPYAPPAYGPPPYGPPGYAAPPPGYSAPPQGYAAVPHGYAQAPQGYAAPAQYVQMRNPGTEKNWMNLVSLIASLSTIITGVGWLAGIIFGHLGVAAAKRGQADNKGMGVAGLVIGYVLGIGGILFVIGLFLLPLIVAGQCVGSDAPEWCTSPTYEYNWEYETPAP